MRATESDRPNRWISVLNFQERATTIPSSMIPGFIHAAVPVREGPRRRVRRNGDSALAAHQSDVRGRIAQLLPIALRRGLSLFDQRPVDGDVAVFVGGYRACGAGHAVHGEVGHPAGKGDHQEA